MTKRVVDRKLYDTETAELIHEYSNGYSVSDFEHVEEELYRTKKGNFFLVGSGGALSPYAVDVDNNATAGSSNNIEPLSKDQAIDWLEAHDGSDIIIELFPDEIEEG